MNKEYIISNTILTINNDIKEYNELIENRLLSFELFEKPVEKKATLVINLSFTSFKSDNVNYLINGKLKKTDIYQLLNNIISNLIINESNVYMHSAVISKNNLGTLLLGGFGQGKTTVSLHAQQNDYTINSADQSWLVIEDKVLYCKLGSKYVKHDSVEQILNNEVIQKIKIDKILFLNGVCENGKYKIEEIENKDHLLKKLFPYCNFHTINPTLTNQVQLKIDNQKIYLFLNSLISSNIPAYNVRGSAEDIVENIGGIIC